MIALPSTQVGHIKRLQHGIKDIQLGKLPPRLLQCVTTSFPATSTPSVTTTTATTVTTSVTGAASAAARAVPSPVFSAHHARAASPSSKCAYS